MTKSSRPHDRPVVLHWERIPVQWWDFWQTLARVAFDRNEVHRSVTFFQTASLLHEWLGEAGVSAGNFGWLEATDYGMFDEWMSQRLKRSRSGNLVEGTKMTFLGRRARFQGLVLAWDEAVSLGRSEVPTRAADTVREVMRNRFRGVQRREILNKAERVLTSLETDRLYELMLQQVLSARLILSGPLTDFPGVSLVNSPGSKKSQYRRTVDVVSVLAIWLALEHGIRPEEVLTLTLSDIQEDLSGNEQHSLYCHAPNKPDRLVPVHRITVGLLRLLVEWTQRPRNIIGTDLLFVDWTQIKYVHTDSRSSPQPVVIDSATLGSRLRNFSLGCNLLADDGNLLVLTMRALRASFGSRLAASTDNREFVRQAMGHATARTTDTYYITQALAELSHNVSKALRTESLRLAMCYRNPVVDLETEAPEAASAIRLNPDRETEYGVCMAETCRRAATCLECEKLVVEVRKRENFVTERDLYRQLAAQLPKEDRVAQQRLRHAAMADAYVALIDIRVEEDRIKQSQQAVAKASRKRRSYK